jgi:hypothetical protein
MAYMCIKQQKECDGCGACQEPLAPCPECGSQEYSVLYERDQKIIGCDDCIERRWVD